MMGSYLEFDLLAYTGLNIIKLLVFLVEFGFYAAAVFLIITVVSGVVRMPKILDKLFVFVVLGLLAFICICLGYTIGLINIECIFRV